MLTDNKLRTFAAVAAEGSFTRASEVLHVSQSAVSQAVSALESEAGAPLLERRAGAVKLTPLGERVLYYSQRILALYEAMDGELRGGAPAPEFSIISLGDGRSARISAADGRIVIETH